MASAEVASQSPDRHGRRGPFATWVKKLTNLKHTDSHNGKKGAHLSKFKKGSAGRAKNNPYPQSGNVGQKPMASEQDSVSRNMSGSDRGSRPVTGSMHSTPASDVVNDTADRSNRSAAPTVATNPGTISSDAGQSKAFTTKTGGGMSSTDGAGVNSTFSSPNQSNHSLATTLTTIQSTSPGHALGQDQSMSQHTPTGTMQGSVSFSQPFPPAPVSALPPHLAPHGNPSTYSTATANNLLTDDASIMTLASSSKRRRRRSMDTDASVRALAPSSVWGGSRESLPLSVLSHNVETPSGLSAGPQQSQSRPSIGGVASAERASIYSSHSVAAPALMSDRNSYYAASLKQSVKDKERDRDNRSIDGRSMNRDADEKSVHGGKSLHGGESIRGYEGSIRSGAIGHLRNDSTATSLNTPLASPGVPPSRPAEPASRRSSTLVTDGAGDGEADEQTHIRDVKDGDEIKTTAS